jgi:ATP-dependent DNA ligase
MTWWPTRPIFMAFDCLWGAGRDLRERALGVRRDQLDKVLASQDVLLPARAGCPTTG